VPTKDPENERQEIHDRRKDPHPSGSGWNGLETRWDENGNMTSKVTYKDGELVE
jgi:antitoxin component YwqK of YwqJK toxin-antitoxin module